MALVVSTILASAAALLNDPSQTAYTNTVLLPFAKKAYQELEIDLELHGIPISFEKTGELSVAIGETTMAQIPSDLVEPLYLEERDYGVTAQRYVPMDRVHWEPDVPQLSSLIRWNWRENNIVFVGATTRRGVRIRYRKFLSAITDANSNVPVLLSQTYMEARTAALAAFLVGEDEVRGEALAADAKEWGEKIIAIAVQNKQGLPVRRRAYRRFLK